MGPAGRNIMAILTNDLSVLSSAYGDRNESRSQRTTLSTISTDASDIQSPIPIEVNNGHRSNKQNSLSKYNRNKYIASSDTSNRVCIYA